MAQALASARPVVRVGFVGMPAGGPQLPPEHILDSNITVARSLALVPA
jgi:threonine dehydrogenase-like Zn-dependent dehydrogenase